MNKKILIVGPSWVGDMIMAQTLFKIIKQNNPYIKLDVLAPEWSISILKRMPEVNQSILLPIQHGKLGLSERWHLAMKIREKKYQQAIVLTNTWKSALIPWLAKIPLRTGWLGECRWLLLNDIRYLNKKVFPKMVQRYAALALTKNQKLPYKLPYPKLITYPKKIKNNKPVLALCPGAVYGPAKRWPEEYFAYIANHALQSGWNVWFFGSQKDNIVIENIRNKLHFPTINYAGKIDLIETIDLLAIAKYVVSNDSGLMHLAVALDKQTVIAIYGSTSPEFTPPLGNKIKIIQKKTICSPCFKRECPLGHFDCMRKITPDKVISALVEIKSSK